MTGEKEQMDGVVKFNAKPNNIDDPRERNIFKRFLAFINPWAVKARNITEDYYGGEAARRVNEAEKFAAETAEIATRTELAKLEKVKLENELIDQVFKDDNLPPQAKMLKMSNILANNPKLREQMEKVDEMFTVLGAVNFTQVDIAIPLDSQIKDKTEISKGQEEEEYFDMKKFFKTKLIDMDISIRTLNVLKSAEVDTIGDLVSFEITDLEKFGNFGKKTLKELKELVHNKGLSFGMDLSSYRLDKD